LALIYLHKDTQISAKRAYDVPMTYQVESN
jgi:hypothetical protein